MTKSFDFFKRDSGGGLTIISYHPADSFTWLWVFSYAPQSKKFGESLGQLKWCLSLGRFGVFNFYVQKRMIRELKPQHRTVAEIDGADNFGG